MSKRKRATYFHVGPPGLPVGHEIAKGSWGQQCRQFRVGGPPLENNGIVFAWECALEAARQSFKRKAPSRLHCVFACITEEGARRFRDERRAGSAIYLVKPVDPKASVFVGDFDLLAGDPAMPFVDTIAARAKYYWTAYPSGLAEVIIDGAVRIVRQIDP